MAITGRAAPGSLHAELERRYQAYRKQVVQAFYRAYFQGFDRQVVLVDLLSVLNIGYQAFIDTREALADILRHFRYGDSSWFHRLFAPKIDRVILAVTQADRVSRDQSPLLKHFLQSMLDCEDIREAGDAGVRIDYMALSALCCTQDVKCSIQGRLASCIRGTLLDGGAPITCFPGQVPSLPPPADDLAGYAFPLFRPAPGRYQYGEGLDHLHLHTVLKHLLGDKIS